MPVLSTDRAHKSRLRAQLLLGLCPHADLQATYDRMKTRQAKLARVGNLLRDHPEAWAKIEGIMRAFRGTARCAASRVSLQQES